MGRGDELGRVERDRDDVMTDEIKSLVSGFLVHTLFFRTFWSTVSFGTD